MRTLPDPQLDAPHDTMDAAPPSDRSRHGRRRRIVVGISGASGAIYGVRLLAMLRAAQVESHLVASRSAQITLADELGMTHADLKTLADVHYPNADIGAAIASGSFRVDGMIIAPCSIKTLSEIATGCTSSLLSRCADVMLKERRRLVLMVRETPLHAGHIRSLAAVTDAGAIVYPPVPAFYAKPASLEQMVDQTLGRVLDLFDIDTEAVHRWHGIADSLAQTRAGDEGGSR